MKHLRCGALVLALGLATGSPGQAAKPPPTPPSLWETTPTAADQNAATAAARAKVGDGRAVARCAVADDGQLTGCRVIREMPVGSGYGAALLSLAPKYRRKPPGKDDPREVGIVTAWHSFDKPADWLRRPTANELMSVYPTEAYKQGLRGRAAISCLITVQGALTDCVALEETPAGSGFGGAAIALTPQFLMRPATLNGTPVVSTVNIPINFITYGKGSIDQGKKVLPANLAWSEAPSYADVAAAFPKKARAEHLGGRATLSCAMSEAGRLKDCEVATSEPKGYGFDLAAKALAKSFALPVTSDGDRKATHSLVVHLPVTFDPANLDQATPVVGKPTWAVIPNNEQLRQAFAAVKVKGTLRVMMACVVRAGGVLADCSVVSEDPAGAGLGPIALSLAPTFRVSTWTTEGLPVVGGSIRIPLRYEPEGDPAPAPK